jgi:DNA helicase TIP49 (TBP-interacting protein)
MAFYCQSLTGTGLHLSLRYCVGLFQVSGSVPNVEVVEVVEVNTVEGHKLGIER